MGVEDLAEPRLLNLAATVDIMEEGVVLEPNFNKSSLGITLNYTTLLFNLGLKVYGHLV